MTRRDRILLRFAGALLGLGWVAAGLGGQTWRWKDLESKWLAAPLKIGPLHVRTEIVLRDVGYDSNVYGTPDHQVGDYGLTFGPQVTAYWPVNRRLLVVVTESPQYAFFVNTRSERAWNNAARGEVYLSLNRLLFSLGLGLNDAKQRWNSESDARPRVKQDLAFGSVLWQVSSKMSLSLGFRRTTYRFEDLDSSGGAFSKRLDHDERFVEATGYYQWSSKGRLSLEAQSGSFDFSDVSDLNNSSTRRLSAGFEFSPARQISGSVRLGYRWISPRLAEREAYGGIVGDASLSARLSRFVKARVSFTRDLPFSFVYSETYYIWDQIGAGLSIYPSSGVRIDYDHLTGRNAYKESRAADSLEPHDDTFGNDSLGIFFRVKKTVGIGITAGRWRRNSAYYGGSSRRFFIGLNLTYNF
jgi:hypothetical protein